MVHFSTSLLGAAALVARLVSAAPMPDSSLGDEVAVSAPNGTPITDTAELASQTAAEAKSAQYQQSYQSMSMGGGCGGGGCGGGYNMNNGYSSMTMMSDMATKTMMSESSSMMMDSSSTMMYQPPMYTMMSESSSMMMDSSSMNMYTATSSAYMSMNTMSYGSGSSNWGGSGYNDCVQQCVASFGAPMATYTPSSSSDYSSSNSYGGSSGGNGVTHTVIVAPTQGVLRYVPFAVNASVGDTIHFQWNANVHTVTKSSQLEICNKTTDGFFTSGSQNKSFTFNQVVNDTNPTFIYCATPGHCQKGMFAIINPPNALVASTSVANMMPGMIQNSSDMAAMAAYTNKMTAGNNAASMWGGGIDMANMPDWSKEFVAQNVMYSRTFLAANPEVISDDGTVDLGKMSGPYMVPQDLSVALSQASASGSPAASATPAASSPAVAAASSPASSAKSGARSLTTSGGAAAALAVAVAFFAL